MKASLLSQCLLLIWILICTSVLGVQAIGANETVHAVAKGEAVDNKLVKIVALLAKRDDISRRQFRQHYENNHVPLAKGVFEGWPGYVRNHIDKVYPQQPLDFDVLTMFWYRDSSHFQSTVELLNGEAGQIIRADENKFMSKATNRYYPVTESGVGFLKHGYRPWNIGFQKSTVGASKIIALVPSTATRAWLAAVQGFADASKPPALIAWVSNQVTDKPENEFEQISELWFSSLADAEIAVSNWRVELPEIIFLSVSTFESSTL